MRGCRANLFRQATAVVGPESPCRLLTGTTGSWGAAWSHPTSAPCLQEFGAFLEALGPLLGRLSYAFSRLVLVCEGTPGFQAQVLQGSRLALPPRGPQRARQHCGNLNSGTSCHTTSLNLLCMTGRVLPSDLQVLCGTEQLLALGRRCGLRMQCHATASTDATATVVGSVARAGLAQWRSSAPGLQYALAEHPPEEESFLTRWAAVRQGGLNLCPRLCVARKP